jgi:hypothetical protein
VAGHEAVRITIEIAGAGSHTITALWPRDQGVRRPRSDQFAVQDDGEPAPGLEGMTAILARLAKHWPRFSSRRERDEEDRAVLNQGDRYEF